MPWESSHTMNQGFCPPEPVVKYIPTHHSLLPGFSSQRFLFFLGNDVSEETGVRRLAGPRIPSNEWIFIPHGRNIRKLSGVKLISGVPK